MDAFSGDLIPAHLLTLKAIEAYLSHLEPQGAASHAYHQSLFGKLPRTGVRYPCRWCSGMHYKRRPQINWASGALTIYRDSVLIRREPLFELQSL
jgi:hypothetical protein